MHQHFSHRGVARAAHRLCRVICEHGFVDDRTVLDELSRNAHVRFRHGSGDHDAVERPRIVRRGDPRVPAFGRCIRIRALGEELAHDVDASEETRFVQTHSANVAQRA